LAIEVNVRRVPDEKKRRRHLLPFAFPGSPRSPVQTTFGTKCLILMAVPPQGTKKKKLCYASDKAGP
jgi:hypothetical protein